MYLHGQWILRGNGQEKEVGD
jgi:hypothetical protein